MAIIKCKMCGGDIVLSEDKTCGTCEYCGSTMTFPKVSDEQRLNLFNRANHFRRQNEFDKAIAAYEKILEQDDTDAEAHWGAVLSRYGIEYVEDPVTHERIPTCHRVQLQSILTDGDYLDAVKHAPDTASRDIYEKEARRIADIQKGILAISSQEKPYDVFICYKESDDSGSRTVDSTLAQEIYYQLTNEGYKVFFSRITLEDKLGQEYEPYIFAALNSAKVMLVVGTRPESFNAVWVKNEWSRYLDLMKSDRSKLLIPCYRDMDPYDLPEALSALQSQDMSKIGFMQDLIRGIKKILQKDEVKPTAVASTTWLAGNTAPLLRRAFMFLEDGDFAKADGFCEQVLNIDPENARAYLGKLMVELKVRIEENLKSCAEPFDKNNHYKKIMRFGDDSLKAQVRGAIDCINDRIEQARQKETFEKACVLLKQAETEKQCSEAKRQFVSISQYEGVNEKLAECDSKCAAIIKAREKTVYDRACSLLMQAGTEDQCVEAKRQFESIPQYEGVNEKLAECDSKCAMIKDLIARRSEADRKVKALRKEAYKKLNSLRKAYEAQMEAFQRADNEVKTAERTLNEAEAEYRAALKTVSDMRIELGNLRGLFNGKRRRELEAEIESSMRRTKELETRVSALRQTLDMKRKERPETPEAPDLPDEQETTYQCAEIYAEAHLYDAAYGEYRRIYSYRDVESIIKNDANIVAAAAAWWAKLKASNLVRFGRYEQDDYTFNGTEDIEWIVLANDGKTATLISKYGLDAKPYNTEKKSVTWETCTIRKWLNGDFMNTAFTPEEQAMLETVKVTADKNPKYNTNPGKDTQDKVFLLSIDEVNHYFASNDARVCIPTKMAKANGVWTNDAGACWWWLRSPGYSPTDSACVSRDGSVYDIGSYVNYEYEAVRPVVVLRLS